jgi:hypothetical protein
MQFHIEGDIAAAVAKDGQRVLVDAADFDLVKDIEWDIGWKGYVTALGQRLHRKLMGEPDGLVDHRNRNKLDNRRENLRVTTPTVNMRNRRGANKTTKTGVQGVFVEKKTGTYYAQVGISGKRYHLGRFVDLEEAAIAACTARVGWTS